jgi:pimeloyl-ACP methyl ester carboxylesterase
MPEEARMKRRDFVTTALITAAAAALPKAANAATNTKEGTAMTTPANRAAAGYAPVNGIELYYQIHGTGKPLVLLHGGVGAFEMFMPILPALTAKHQVIGVDLQAHGRTLPFDRPMTHENMATDIAELIKWLGYEKADVMGYSLGAMVSMRTAIDHPEVVDKLVVVSMAAAYAGWHEYNQQGMKMMSGANAEAMKQSPMYELYVQIAPDPSLWAKSLDQIGSLKAREFDWLPEMSSIKSKTIIIAGDWDAVKMTHLTEMFAKLGGGLQDAMWDNSGMNANRMALLPGATHYTTFMDPRMADAALGFLDA